MVQPPTGKLVRDGIPEIIRSSGGDPELLTLDEDQYLAALRLKLVEEANEVLGADDKGLVEELADVLEVLAALVKANDIDWADIERKREEKHAERGGFQNRCWLVS